jgi:DNA-binding CsgD family transcriptional regulator
LLPGEKAPLAGSRNPLSDGVMAARELGLAYAAGLAEGFDILGSAALIIDQRRRVILANRTARTTLTTALRIVRDQLISGDREASKKIAQLVDQVMSSEGSALRPPAAIPRPPQRPLMVYALRLAGDAQDMFSPARALIIILDLEIRAAPAEAHMQRVFGLTSAESRLVVQLARGEALETAADLLQVSKETARTQLKAVFAKTETSRQSELVALIGRLLSERSGS